MDGGGLACTGCKTEVVRSPARVSIFFYFKSIEIGSGTRPPSCSLGSGGAFLWDKGAGTWS